MASLTITNNDLGTVILDNARFENEVLTFPGADTYVEGTILARKEVSDTVTVTPGGGNTGNGTVTAAPAAGSEIPLVGNYVLTCLAAVTNGGIFELVDPNGNLVAGDLTMIAGAGVATTFVAGGLAITVTDGATDFVATDTFTLAVAVDGTFVVYAVDGIGGAQIPNAVLTYDVTATGAGTAAIRALVSGNVRRDKLIIDAGGTVTDAIADMLRHTSIIPFDVSELNIYDNQ